MFTSSQIDQTTASTEPMVVSSGNSSGSPYLPSFLIGDTHSSFTAVSASPRLWSMGSPTKQQSPSSSNSKQPSFSVNVVQQTSNTPRTGRLAGEKAGGPPVQSLFDSFSSPARSEGRSLIGVNGMTTTPVENESSFSFRDAAEEVQPDDTWVTVFGFPPGATSYVLQQFSQYGTVLEHRVAPNGNWVHLCYQSKLQAKKALSKNGKVFSDSIMVGVKPCTDKAVLRRVKNVHDESCKENLPMTKDIVSPERLSGIRPLTQAYRMASNEREVTTTPTSRVPQKTAGLVSKAMEYVFSW